MDNISFSQKEISCYLKQTVHIPFEGYSGTNGEVFVKMSSSKEKFNGVFSLNETFDYSSPEEEEFDVEILKVWNGYLNKNKPQKVKIKFLQRKNLRENTNNTFDKIKDIKKFDSEGFFKKYQFQVKEKEEKIKIPVDIKGQCEILIDKQYVKEYTKYISDKRKESIPNIFILKNLLPEKGLIYGIEYDNNFFELPGIVLSRKNAFSELIKQLKAEAEIQSFEWEFDENDKGLKIQSFKDGNKSLKLVTEDNKISFNFSTYRSLKNNIIEIVYSPPFNIKWEEDNIPVIIKPMENYNIKKTKGVIKIYNNYFNQKRKESKSSIQTEKNKDLKDIIDIHYQKPYLIIQTLEPLEKRIKFTINGENRYLNFNKNNNLRKIKSFDYNKLLNKIDVKTDFNSWYFEVVNKNEFPTKINYIKKYVFDKPLPDNAILYWRSEKRNGYLNLKKGEKSFQFNNDNLKRIKWELVYYNHTIFTQVINY